MDFNISQLLLKENLVNEDDLKKFLKLSKERNERLDKVLLKEGHITEETLLQFLSKILSIPFISELSIDIKNDKFYVWGYLGKKSSHFKILKMNYPNLEFGGRPKGLKMGYVFDEIPDHQYFDLLSFNFLSKKS